MSPRTLAPPSSNTGAERTKPTGLIACYDWLGVTFQNLTERQVIEEVLLLNPDDFTEMDIGMYGYPLSLRLGNISILYGGRKEMGVHLSMTGKGCREYEHIGKVPWKALFRVMLAVEAQFSRLDVALDDYIGYWSITQVVNKVKRNELVSRFRSAKRIEQVKIGDGSTTGETVYFGSSTSMIIIRMYNKALEQLGREGINPNTIPEIWNRTEIQARKERAQTIAGLIANDIEIGTIIKGILKYYLRFVVKQKTDSNKRRWPVAKWWEHFLRNVEPLALKQNNEMEASVEKRLTWMRKQVAPTLAVVIRAMDGEMSAIYDLIQDGMSRLKPRDQAMIKQYQETTTLSG
ncbi:replication initiation factor [Hazenella sp. IB182357]|uniref:Replication initiation factor n=1 Tax=Polycladospora coralii TaxID=2771432 RepID=A0A926RW91_9BACL|nr:replication initiation factor domain-containing protein [Polycladospora coralii]MBD1371251.1 replication initiation factor [Polycladospora coralii]